MNSEQYSLRKDGKKKISEHFTAGMFACKNKTDKILINPGLVKLLEKLYTYLNCTEIRIISGYRTPAYSPRCGGYPTDRHTTGEAADIRAYRDGNIISTEEVCTALEGINPDTGIGIIDKNGSVHLDIRGYKCYFDETKDSRTLYSFKNYFEKGEATK